MCKHLFKSTSNISEVKRLKYKNSYIFVIFKDRFENRTYSFTRITINPFKKRLFLFRSVNPKKPKANFALVRVLMT